MVNKISVSIVIPVYNEENHLEACLKAIAKQKVKPLEVIVVDNNSSDKSVKIAKSFRFVTVLTEPKQGVLFARNRGFDAAKGDVIGRIDGDTVIDANWVQELQRIFTDSTVAAATGPVYWYDMPLKEKNYIAEHMIKGLIYKYGKEFPFLLGANMAVRAEDWKFINPKLCSSRNMHEDMDLAIHLFKANQRILYDPKLRAGASTRRFDVGLEDFYHYSEMLHKAFSSHKMSTTGAKAAIAAYHFWYFLLYPLRRSYDQETGRRSLKQLVKGHKARKNPMSAN